MAAKKLFTQIFIYFSKPLRLLYSLIIYEIVNFSFFTLYSLLLLSFFLYLKSVPIYVIVHVHASVLYYRVCTCVCCYIRRLSCRMLCVGSRRSSRLWTRGSLSSPHMLETSSNTVCVCPPPPTYTYIHTHTCTYTCRVIRVRFHTECSGCESDSK